MRQKQDRRTPWGMRIKERREALGLTQDQLADLVFNSRGPEGNFTGTSVANLETGQTRDPHLTTVRDIAEALNVSLDWLITGSEFVKSPPKTVRDVQAEVGRLLSEYLQVQQPEPVAKPPKFRLIRLSDYQARELKRRGLIRGMVHAGVPTLIPEDFLEQEWWHFEENLPSDRAS